MLFKYASSFRNYTAVINLYTTLKLSDEIKVRFIAYNLIDIVFTVQFSRSISTITTTKFFYLINLLE